MSDNTINVIVSVKWLANTDYPYNRETEEIPVQVQMTASRITP